MITVFAIFSLVEGMREILSFFKETVWPDVLRMGIVDAILPTAVFLALCVFILLVPSLVAAWGISKLFPNLAKETT